MIDFGSFSDPRMQRAFNTLNTYLLRLRSVPLIQVDDLVSLPNATAFDRQQVIVLDIDGGGTIGIATAVGGVWIDYTGATIA